MSSRSTSRTRNAPAEPPARAPPDPALPPLRADLLTGSAGHDTATLRVAHLRMRFLPGLKPRGSSQESAEHLSTGWNNPDSGDVAAHTTFTNPFPAQAMVHGSGPRAHVSPRHRYWDWVA